MTESGNPKDNAMAERINSTMKNELLHGRIFTSLKTVAKAGVECDCVMPTAFLVADAIRHYPTLRAGLRGCRAYGTDSMPHKRQCTTSSKSDF